MRIDVGAYSLWLDGQAHSRLEGGPLALLPGTATHLSPRDIEIAIDRAEEWLMTFSKSIEGLQLLVRDATGRLRISLHGKRTFAPADVEDAFERLLQRVAHGRSTNRESTADIVLLRELVHHGSLSQVILEAGGV